MVTSENQTFFTGSQLLLLEKGGHYPVTIIPDRVTRKRKAGSAEVQPKKQDSDQELMVSNYINKSVLNVCICVSETESSVTSCISVMDLEFAHQVLVM